MEAEDVDVDPAGHVARVIARDRGLMDAYKAGCRDGRVQAVASGGRNYVGIRDADLADRIATINPGIPRLAWDEATGEVREP